MAKPSMPPYLGESHESVLKFLAKVDLSKFDDPFEFGRYTGICGSDRARKQSCKSIRRYCTSTTWLEKMMKLPWYKIWGYDPVKTPSTSFTIGIDTPDVVRQKVKEAEIYNILKVKLGRDTDKMMIETIRQVTDKPICVDINQGWTDRQFALDMANWLHERGVVFIEQAMPKERVDDNCLVNGKKSYPNYW